MICKAYDRFFKNFASRSNLRIISLLKARGMNVNEIVSGTGMEQSAVSHCLRKLYACNVVAVESRGRERVYSLNKKTVVPLLDLVDRHVKAECKRCTKHE